MNPISTATIVEKLEGIIARNKMPLVVTNMGYNTPTVQVKYMHPVNIKGTVATEPRLAIEFAKDAAPVAWVRKDAPAENDFRWKMEWKWNSYGYRNSMQAKSGKINWNAIEQEMVSWWADGQRELSRAQEYAERTVAKCSVLNHPDVATAMLKNKTRTQASTGRTGDTNIEFTNRNLYADGYRISIDLTEPTVATALAAIGAIVQACSAIDAEMPKQ